MSPRLRFLVTGPTGFLGRNVVSELLAAGHAVKALLRVGERIDDHPLPAVVEIAHGDILDVRSLDAAAAGCEALAHCAGKVSRDPADAEIMHRIHVEGTKNVLDAARRAGVRRAVVASTSGTVAISDDPDDVRDESSPAPMDLIARWPYYRSKLFAELAALEKNAPPEFEVVVVCPSLLLGPGDLLGSSTGDVADFVEGRLPAVPGGGISFVDARDAANAMVLAFEHGRPGERYLVAAQNLTLRAFTSKLERISGVKAPAVKLPRSHTLARIGAYLEDALKSRRGPTAHLDRTGVNSASTQMVSVEMAQYFWYVDARKAKDELGWQPRDPHDTLADTVNDLRSRGVVWG